MPNFTIFKVLPHKTNKKSSIIKKFPQFSKNLCGQCLRVCAFFSCLGTEGTSSREAPKIYIPNYFEDTNAGAKTGLDTSLAALGALAHCLKPCTACKILFSCQEAPKWSRIFHGSQINFSSISFHY